MLMYDLLGITVRVDVDRNARGVFLDLNQESGVALC